MFEQIRGTSASPRRTPCVVVCFCQVEGGSFKFATSRESFSVSVTTKLTLKAKMHIQTTCSEFENSSTCREETGTVFQTADGRDGGGDHHLASLTQRHESVSGEEAADCLGSEPEAKRCNYRRSVGVQQIQRLPTTTTTTTTSSEAAGLECDTAACLREAE